MSESIDVTICTQVHNTFKLMQVRGLSVQEAIYTPPTAELPARSRYPSRVIVWLVVSQNVTVPLLLLTRV